jgi:hypothetical protein
MRLLISVLATAAMILSASAAFAQATWSVDAFTSDGSPVAAPNPGTQIILDITLRTTDFALGIAGSVNDYDTSILRLDAASSIIPTSVLNAICVAPGSCFGGLVNQVGGAITFQERAVGPGVEAEFLAAVATSPAGGTGTLDQGAVTGVAGDPQFRIVFDVLAPGMTTLQIGTYAEYLDGYTGTASDVSNNTTLTIGVIPEPGTALLMGLGLAALAGAGRRS